MFTQAIHRYIHVVKIQALQMKQKFCLPAQVHVMPLSSHAVTSYQFGMCLYFICLHTNTKFYECKHNNCLVCCSLLNAQQNPKRSKETWIIAMGDMQLGSWGTCMCVCVGWGVWVCIILPKQDSKNCDMLNPVSVSSVTVYMISFGNNI